MLLLLLISNYGQFPKVFSSFRGFSSSLKCCVAVAAATVVVIVAVVVADTVAVAVAA